jgi:hypothetical protein
MESKYTADEMEQVIDHALAIGVEVTQKAGTVIFEQYFNYAEYRYCEADGIWIEIV